MKKPKHDFNILKFYAIVRKYTCYKHNIKIDELDAMFLLYGENIMYITALYNSIPRHNVLYKRMKKMMDKGLVDRLGKLDYRLTDKGVTIIDEFYDNLLNTGNLNADDIEDESSMSYAIIRGIKKMNDQVIKKHSAITIKRWNEFRAQKRRNGNQ